MRVKLEDVCVRGSSNLKQSDVIDFNGSYPIYGASGMIGKADFYHQNAPYVSVIKDGAGIGRTAIHPAKSSVIGTMQYLIPKDNILPEYLYYVVKHMHLEKYYTGATIPHIYFKDYKNEEFNFDDIENQKKIVTILNKIQTIIDTRKRQLEKYDELIKARFVEMFGDPITNSMRWEMVSIGDVVKEVKYGTSKPAIEGGKYPYLRMNNLTMDGHLDLSDLKFIDIPNDEVEKYIVRQGDVLFNRTNSIDLVGKTAVFDLPDAMIIAGYIIRVRLNERLLPEIFSQYMNLEALKSILKNMAKGAVNQANINAQELKKIKIYVPDIQTQRQFIKIKEQIDKSKFVELK